jgi:hypothetical protein
MNDPERYPADLVAERDALKAEVERLRAWVNDLQAGMYINCVYCGHRYGPDDEVPATMADVLKAHIEKCPEHPMSKLRTDLTEANRLLDLIKAELAAADPAAVWRL